VNVGGFTKKEGTILKSQTEEPYFFNLQQIMSDLHQKIGNARQSLENLKRDIDNVISSKKDRSLLETSRSRNAIDGAAMCHLRQRRNLQGHFGKVYAVSWSGDGTHLVSASQDGKLMIWNGNTTHKVQSIPLASSWVITCAFEQSNNRLVACGGMDNICSIYNVERTQSRVIRVAHVC
jgi:guanine nucleotide-binding protein G(I)/G(S)/G(T) subunit beta-1